MNKLFYVAFVVFFGCASSAWASSSPRVLASIKPVAMLVKAVVGDEFAVDVLLSPNTSPHEYALKFSDLKAVKQAELVVWVGPELEGVLVKALVNVPSDKVVQLTQLDNIQWPEVSHERHDHHGHEEHISNGDKNGEPYNRDPHLWLNPHNSLKVVEAIAVVLANKYPERKTLFEANVREFSEQLTFLDESIQKGLEQVKGNGFLVVHDGYGHFVEHFGLNQLAAIQLPGGANRGARHYGEIIALGDRVTCVFTEPQLNNKLALQLAKKLASNHAELDLMGGSTPLSKSSYLEFIRSFAETFTTCLERSPVK
ncbi:MAG: zinc ABC transporter substrate-binding protein [Porticoccus sp.]|nr:zinc ABC transporter substrate-binding protein [Porticoccus sp.]